MKRFYCTYFDRNYLARGLALIASLRAHSEEEWQLFVICMDLDSLRWVEKAALANITAYSLDDVERDDMELVAAKADRSRVEYLWTTTPAIILWLFKRHLEAALLTYLDADLWFYSSPEPIFAELGDDSVLIHEHRYPPELRDMEINGKYNVGLLCFRHDKVGLTALRWWRERCIESCHLDIKNGKCGDQMYLNDWPERFAGVRVLQNVGAGVAPWNVNQYRIETAGGAVLVNQTPLIFYHFHGLTILGSAKFRFAYRFFVSRAVAEHIYAPHCRALEAAMKDIRRIEPSFVFSFKRPTVIEKAWDLLFRSRMVSQLIATVRQRMRQAA